VKIESTNFEPLWNKNFPLYKSEDFENSKIYNVKFIYKKFKRKKCSLAYSTSTCNAKKLSALAIY